MTDSEIILCSGIKMDKNYENVLSYNEEAMVNLCRSKAICTGSNYKIVGVRENIINVSARYEDCIYANYIAFTNKKYGNKWFFAWVTDVKLLNPATTEITFQIDVFSTWYSRFNLNQVFIEREHVEDDTIGKHTIPENLELGDYVVNAENKCNLMTTYDYILASNVDPVKNGQGKYPLASVKGGIYNGIMHGFKYYYFMNTSATELPDVLQAISDAGKADSVIAIFIAPHFFFEKSDPTELDNGQVKETYSAMTCDWEQNGGDAPVKPTTIDTYEPVNNKLFTFPFCYLRMTNNNGNDAIYHFERFANNSENKCYFQFKSSICPGMSIILYPNSYDGIANNFNECLQAGKFPVCGWSNDAYTNWLTQNAVNIATNLTGNALTIAGSGASVVTGNPMGASGVLGGISGIANTLGTIFQHKLNPMQAEGNTNTGDVKTSSGLNTFTAYTMTIKKEMAKVIDEYFSRFGYQVNEVKTPNLNSRSKFNFIKVGGMDELVSGNIPASALEEINSIFRKGVTIFHNYNDIGNYTISNPIV